MLSERRLPRASEPADYARSAATSRLYSEHYRPEKNFLRTKESAGGGLKVICAPSCWSFAPSGRDSESCRSGRADLDVSHRVDCGQSGFGSFN